MAMVKCKECGNDISSKAPACPKCGAKVERTSAFTWLMAIFIGAPFLYIAFSTSLSKSNTPPAPPSGPAQIEIEKKKDAALEKAIVGAQALKKSTRDASSFNLESALLVNGTGAVCYDYRAKNGFGGINVGHAVLSADGKKFKTNEEEGFAALWNKECAKKSGSDVAAAIRAYVL